MSIRVHCSSTGFFVAVVCRLSIVPVTAAGVRRVILFRWNDFDDNAADGRGNERKKKIEKKATRARARAISREDPDRVRRRRRHYLTSAVLYTRGKRFRRARSRFSGVNDNIIEKTVFSSSTFLKHRSFARIEIEILKYTLVLRSPSKRSLEFLKICLW